GNRGPREHERGHRRARTGFEQAPGIRKATTWNHRNESRCESGLGANAAEGEGLEPSIRLTTDNGFRALRRLRLKRLVQADSAVDGCRARRSARRYGDDGR